MVLMVIMVWSSVILRPHAIIIICAHAHSRRGRSSCAAAVVHKTKQKKNYVHIGIRYGRKARDEIYVHARELHILYNNNNYIIHVYA